MDEREWEKKPDGTQRVLDVVFGLLAFAFFIFVIWKLGGLAVEALRG